MRIDLLLNFLLTVERRDRFCFRTKTRDRTTIRIVHDENIPVTSLLLDKRVSDDVSIRYWPHQFIAGT